MSARNSSSSQVFFMELGHRVSETLYTPSKRHTQEKRAAQDGDVTVLPPKKRGRPVLLGENLDRKVQLYLEKEGVWFL